MASDLVVALGQATVGGITLFGGNAYAPNETPCRPQLLPARKHPPDEHIRATYVRLPQARQTHAVLGCRLGDSWGFIHGVNENNVAVGVARWQSRLPAVGGGLTGTDLARLALERSHTALQAVDVLSDLIGRHGQCPTAASGRFAGPADSVFLIADSKEAFVLEAAGRYWAILECKQVRAVTDVALIRQDWHRLSPGLASHAIENGWWEDDGTKLDFAGCLEAEAASHWPARRRWGRATLALEQQNGAIDGHFLRRMLFDHYDSVAGLRTHWPPAPLAGSFMTALHAPEEPALAWCAFGPPRIAVSFPVWLDGELPAALQDSDDIVRQTRELAAFDNDGDRRRLAESLERLQATFDQDVEAVLPQVRQLKRQGDAVRLRNQLTALMQKHAALFAQTCRRLHGAGEPQSVRIEVEEFVAYFS